MLFRSGFDDAQYAAVRLIRALGIIGAGLTEAREAMALLVTTPELRFPVDPARKAAVVDEVAARLAAIDGAEVNMIDGVRVTGADGWWLLRASNTQDVLVARAEAEDEAALARLLATVDDQLGQSGVSRAAEAP